MNDIKNWLIILFGSGLTLLSMQPLAWLVFGIVLAAFMLYWSWYVFIRL